MSEWLFVHGFLAGFRLFRQGIHKNFQSSAVIRTQFRFERIRQSSPQSAHPAFPLVVEISTSSGKFTGWVDLYSISGTHDPQHLPFGQNLAAAYARPLWNMFHTLGRFLRHLLITRKELFPIAAGFIFAAFMDLAADHCAEVFIELQFDGFLFALLTFLLIG